MEVMVVDDEKDILDLVEQALKLNGFDVIKAKSGIECLELLKAGKIPDLILLDIMMPEMDGFQVCAKIKDDEKYKNIKVVMLSAKNQNRDVVDSYKKGADGYIQKPFDPQKLVEEVKIYINI